MAYSHLEFQLLVISLGQLKLARLSEKYHCIFFVADLHAITVPQEPSILRANTLKLLAFFLAAGVDPKKSLLTIQSHVPQHCEFSWLLSCYAHVGELSRMTQFKDKTSALSEKAEPFGLFAYPVLMAAIYCCMKLILCLWAQIKSNIW